MLNTPVVVFMYRRPDLTREMLRVVHAQSPQTLYVISDGGLAGEERIVRETREVVESFEWKGQLHKCYADEHLGCFARVRSGLEWVFGREAQAIIIEDDIVPTTSFFRFCTELLAKYQSDARVSSISGSNIGYTDDLPSSYRFTKFMNMWGWATWRRAFKRIDFEMSFWPAYRKSPRFRAWLERDPAWIRHWTQTFDHVWHAQGRGQCPTWDLPWILSNLHQETLSISPRVNLTWNLGYRDDATHTFPLGKARETLTAREMEFPLVHAPFRCDATYETYLKTAWRDLEGALHV